MSTTIDEPARVVADEVCSVIRAAKPSADDIRDLQEQLLIRHNELKLEPVISAEDVVEGFFRCHLADYVVRRFQLQGDALPDSMNSSHRAVRRVCVASRQHHHLSILDTDWAKSWVGMQTRCPGVNIRAGRRSPRRADLYIVAKQQVISLEFKYVGASGIRDAAGCEAQMLRHAENHERALFVVYSELPAESNAASIGLRENASLVATGGCAIKPFRGAA